MDIFINLDLLSVATAIAAIGILGFLIYFRDKESITARAFLYFSLITIAYSAVNYLSYKITNLEVAFWILKLSIFFAVWHSFFLFRFFFVFPSKEVSFSKNYKFLLLPLVTITSLLTMTPLVFREVLDIAADGRIIKVSNGYGIALFSIVVLSLVLSAFYILFKKIKKATGVEKSQLRLISVGTFITFAFLIIFHLILPAFFNNPRFIPLGALFIFPFVAFTAYAILRHKLFDIKIASVALLTFVLAVVTFLEIIFADSAEIFVLRVSVFILVLSFGVLLLRSVSKEVDMREEMQKLAEKLFTANEKLKELDKLKSDFVSMASHQLRSPLTAVKGYSSMILEGSFGKINDKLKLAVDKISQSSERLIKFVNDLLNMSRIERGKMQYEFEEADIGEVVESVMNELQSVVNEKKGLVLKFQKPNFALPKLQLDLNKIRQVVVNLVDNAIKYTPTGKVLVSISKKGDWIEVEVKDTGVGMSKEDVKKLFAQFVRADKISNIASGSGMGLYVARQIARGHKGDVVVESTGKGKGSTFIIKLPIH